MATLNADSMNHFARQQNLREALAAGGLDALLVTHLPNIRYLCGFSGSAAALLLHAGGSVFFTDGRYAQQARDQVRAGKIVIAKKAPLPAAGEWLSRQPRQQRTTKA